MAGICGDCSTHEIIIIIRLDCCGGIAALLVAVVRK